MDLEWILEFNYVGLMTFVLVLSRISGLMVISPVYGSVEVPAQVRIFFVLSISLILTPMQFGSLELVPVTLMDLLIAMAGELVVGIAMGTAIMIFFSGTILCGQIVGQMSGLALAESYHPATDSNSSIFSSLFYWMLIGMYLCIGGHRFLLQALLETFTNIPLGTGLSTIGSFSGMLTTVLAQSYVIGIIGCGPMIVALLLTTVVLGLISRALPQLNILALGFGFSNMITFAGLMAGMSGIAWAFTSQIFPTIEFVFESIAGQVT